MSTPSEQENHLELEREPRLADPRAWQTDDPDNPDNSDGAATGDDPTGDQPAEQLTAPDGGGDFGDEEPDAIAEDAGTSYPAGPEAQAMRIDEEP